MRFKLFLASLSMGAASMAAAADIGTSVTTMQIVSGTERYLGSIPFQGGVLSRGEINLYQSTEIRSLRIESPSFCKIRVLEAGTVSDGRFNVAQRTSNPNLFLVNDGRGGFAQSVFVSLDGPNNFECNVLVYANAVTSEPAPPPPPNNGPDSLQAIVCITNSQPVSFEANLSTDGRYQFDFAIPAGKTTMFLSKLRSDRSAPYLQVGFDADMTSGYYPMTTAISTVIQSTPNCLSAARYEVRQRFDSPYLEIVRF